MHIIRKVAFHLLKTLDYIWNSKRCVHTDLKPENLLVFDPDSIEEINQYDLLPIQFWENPFVNEDSWRQNLAWANKDEVFLYPRNLRTTVVDFGGMAIEDEEEFTGLVNTRQYRSPEVTL